MRSLDFSVYLIIPAALKLLGFTKSLIEINMYQEIFFGIEAGQPPWEERD
jgi:hypothetical protein